MKMITAFRVEIEELGGDVRAAVVTGELDQATVPELKQALEPAIDAGSGSLLVDLSDCAFIDSSGLAALLATRERITATAGRAFAVCCPDTQVRRLLEITGLDRTVGLTDSRDDALLALRAAATPSA
jgi:anti-sigma B factor antagonist